MISEAPSGRLREARERLGVTRSQLSAKLGISQSTLRAHENGQNGIQPAMAEQYASELGVAPEWILYGSIPRENFEPSKLSEIPIAGHVQAGYFKDQVVNIDLKSIYVSVPGYQDFNLKAYLNLSAQGTNFVSYIICSPWHGDALYLVDEVVLRKTEGPLAEVDVWKVGVDPGWVVFYKGPTQSAASDLLKFRPGSGSHIGQSAGVWILGLVVARLDYLPAKNIRAFEFPDVRAAKDC